MRQRASNKTQRRLKQQQLRDPYALTDDVYTEAPTFHVGGLVTAVGVLQVVVAMALIGFMFGGALLFCAVLLAVLGVALVHHSDPKGNKQGLGLKQAINRLLSLRRSALDYSLTLSIAHSQQQTQKELEIAVVPSSPTPQKVVATMALKQEVRKTKKTMGGDPLVTLHPVDMRPLPTIHSCSVTEELLMEKPRANSEPKQVLRSRPLMPLKPKTQQLGPVQEKKQMQKTVLPTHKKSQQVQAKAQPKPQPQDQRIKPELEAPKVTAKKEFQLPAVLPKAVPKVVIPAVLQKVEPVAEVPKPKPVGVAPPAKTIVVEPAAPVVAPLPIFQEQKTLVEIARGEAPMERELTFTRKVTLYLNPQDESVVDLEEDLEQELDEDLEQELDQEQENFSLSLEAFPPLSPPMIPQAPKPLPAIDVMEPNFLMHIELEPISKPEKKLISLNSLRLKPVDDADLRSMLIELDSMQQELDAAMARCNSLLNGEEEKVSASELEPEEEPIFCC